MKGFFSWVSGGIRLLFDRLSPVDRRADGEHYAVQIERALSWVVLISLVGFLVIGLLAFAQPSNGWRFFGLGALAALVASGAGFLLGMLFGLPASNARVTVVNEAPAAHTEAGGRPASSSPVTATGTTASAGSRRGSDDWYRDNTSLEQIAQWLTGAIVALSLANFDSWIGRFNNVAHSLSCTMYVPIDGRCSDPVGITGGLILAIYAIFGFLAGYLWSRIYLMGELAGARFEQWRTQLAAQVVGEQRIMDRAEVADLVQNLSRGELKGREIPVAPSVRTLAEEATNEFSLVERGTLADDPWKGQFGGSSRSGMATITADVVPLSSRPGLYQVNIRVGGHNAAALAGLANQPFMLYLHPTFPNPIRQLNFDSTGQAEVPLIAYGAFTVGVQLKNGETLELDLAQLPGITEQFRLS